MAEQLYSRQAHSACLTIRPFFFVCLNLQDLLDGCTPRWQLNVKGRILCLADTEGSTSDVSLKEDWKSSERRQIEGKRVEEGDVQQMADGRAVISETCCGRSKGNLSLTRALPGGGEKPYNFFFLMNTSRQCI